MFTGLIADIGELKEIDESRGDKRLVITTSFDMRQFKIGASIACSGVCLTVVDKGDDWFAVDISSETIVKTGICNWEIGTPINLESSLRLGDELGGHVVSGHVDGLAEIISISKDGDSHRVSMRVPEHYSHYIAAKGSIAINGVSLTVNNVNGNEFEVNIILHTWGHTTFGSKKVGDMVNFEIDMLARYVARMLGKDT